MTTRTKPRRTRSTNGAARPTAEARRDARRKRAAALLAQNANEVADEWAGKAAREWSAVVPAALDPAYREAEATDGELFDDIAHPLGSVEMWAVRGVTAHADFDHPVGRTKGEIFNADLYGQGSIDVIVATNIKGSSPLTLVITAAGGLTDTNSSQEGLALHLAVTPEALVSLAVLLPRVVEMARREGLLARPQVTAGEASRA